MKYLSIIAFTVSLILSFQASAVRTMYVDNFSNILGDSVAENELLSYSQANGIEQLLLYELHIVNATYDITHYSTSGILADFISKAKDNYGIQKIGAIGENAMFFFDVIIAYNNSRSNAIERIDIFNLEFEFWNQAATNPGGYYCDTYLTPNSYPCTNDGAFGFVLSELTLMNQLANMSFHPITTEAYIGWITVAQASQICGLVDRLLVHAYVTDPNDAYAYVEDRIIDISNFGSNLNVSIIFSSEPNFMQSWLSNNSMIAAETIFYNDWLNGSSSWWWGTTMNLEGFTYFAYGFNQNVVVSTENIESSDKISISPNPVTNILSISSDYPIENIRIYDHLGKLILETYEQNINCSQLAAGLYSVHIISNQNLNVTKFVKN